MRDGDFRIRMTRSIALGVVGCARAESPTRRRRPPRPPARAARGCRIAGGGCPANGSWAECSVIYRLERAGLAPQVDSAAKPNEKNLGGTPIILKIGLSAELELHLYADSAARVAAVSTLDRSQFVNGTAQQTMKRERTLIESVNLVGFLTSINAHQRERVSDALTAGPPQPPAAQIIHSP